MTAAISALIVLRVSGGFAGCRCRMRGRGRRSAELLSSAHKSPSSCPVVVNSAVWPLPRSEKIICLAPGMGYGVPLGPPEKPRWSRRSSGAHMPRQFREVSHDEVGCRIGHRIGWAG